MELWSSTQAAQHWGVTPARARALLAERRIPRVSGYPASDILAVRRRQGARTDLTPAGTSLTLSEAAAAIAGIPDDANRLRVFFEFCRGADEAGPRAVALGSAEPALIGDPRFDALLAAAAEYVSCRFGLPGPLWTVTLDRFLSRAWWVSPLPSARRHALLWTPASFRRRGIYLDRHDLSHDGVPVMPEPLFDVSELHRAFAALALKLQRRNIVGHVHVVGGAAMLLAYDPDRLATRDIDALFGPDGPMIAAIHEVADENHWPASWLNNQAAVYVARSPGEGIRVFDHPHLQVVATPADHLLAMKTLAARAVRDAEDLRFLVGYLGITSAAEVWAIVERFFPGVDVPQRSRDLIDDLF
ncbi:hypothetical protein DQP56_00530 [Mycolicibacter senuensis]|uniref:Uncharacterized protein n=1 Tax=Mycolicibacter longobardus TaxID=1108812 RepID=A0A1X1YC29_9MYCO|nr:hypothetical protein AWC16_19320 [Mycolicibacter longobardus]RAV04338.1 hypothetical protein DQP56_00530 [Mycolicibacter senuensis]